MSIDVAGEPLLLDPLLESLDELPATTGQSSGIDGTIISRERPALPLAHGDAGALTTACLDQV
ncbi:MAG TPA: hypothetical protein VG388_13310 [Solirubrobacteraceae bacterium]|nr:hypothetical protein [Solirubrobacteraceae bacterium]